MVYVIALGVALSVTLLVAVLAQLMPAQPKHVRERLLVVAGDHKGELARRRRDERRRRLEALLMEVGQRFETKFKQASAIKLGLLNAGYRNNNAVAYYWGARLLATGALGFGMSVLLSLSSLRPAAVVLLSLYAGAIGWIAPTLIIIGKKRRRQKELRNALPDALDLMVVCVEAGLGLNQALKRVGQEMTHVSEEMSKELALVNLEIRAGTPRPDALQNLATRTGLDDIQALVTMLVQTDRFGTSIARSLRVHSDTLREKRRQRAEEAAAKTTIKLVFPLVLCIFPALLVVILGGGIIRIVETLGSI